MVNSLQRLFTEIIETLDRAGQSVSDPYARSQVFAVIDILTNLTNRVEWKRSDLKATINDLQALFSEIVNRIGKSGACPAALTTLREQLSSATTAQPGEDLVAERDRLSQLLIHAMERFAVVRTQLPVSIANEIDQLCNAYLRRQLDRDIALARRPMFRRMSQA